MASFIKSDNHIILVFDDGTSTTVYNTNENYGAVCTAVRAKQWEKVKELAQPVEFVKKTIKDLDKVAITDGLVTYDDVPMHTTLTTRMLEMHADGFDISYMAQFLENMMENPSYRAVNELYTFLEKSDLPITEDGHFLAYKRVDGNFKDIHSGKFDNSPGTVVVMRRNTVNEDKNQTCSAGLHFCSREYLPSYGTSADNKVVMIKINPADVVAIPSDYNDAKGRCCKYYVVKEMDIDFDSDGNVPAESLETSFKDSRIVVDELVVEQLNLADALLGTGEPKIIATFDTPTDAMHKIVVDSSSIVKVCNGDRKSAGGFAWRWSSDNPLHRLEDDGDDEYLDNSVDDEYLDNSVDDDSDYHE